MPEHLAAMDICVIPHSNTYRSPIKLFEYMARAQAIVAPRTEPIALVLRHGGNGLLFNPEDADDLRAQMAALIEDPALRSRLGGQARRDVGEKHTWKKKCPTIAVANRLKGHAFRPRPRRGLPSPCHKRTLVSRLLAAHAIKPLT